MSTTRTISSGRVLATLEALNLRSTSSAVSMAIAGLAEDRRAWSMKQNRRIPNYTTMGQPGDS